MVNIICQNVAYTYSDMVVGSSMVGVIPVCLHQKSALVYVWIKPCSRFDSEVIVWQFVDTVEAFVIYGFHIRHICRYISSM